MENMVTEYEKYTLHIQRNTHCSLQKEIQSCLLVCSPNESRKVPRRTDEKYVFLIFCDHIFHFLLLFCPSWTLLKEKISLKTVQWTVSTCFLGCVHADMRCLGSQLKSQSSVFTHKTLSTQAVWTSWCRGGLREMLSFETSVWTHKTICPHSCNATWSVWTPTSCGEDPYHPHSQRESYFDKYI